MRKLMMAVAAVAGLAMVPGCKRDSVESERRDVAEARQEAAQDVAEARQEEAQDIASARQDAQEEIASARQDVREEQEELAEARQERQEDLAEGGSGMAGTAAAATNVQGRVLSTGHDSLTLVDTSNNKQLELKTNDQTRILRNNAPVELDDLAEGTQVRASYVMDGKDMVVRELTVTQPVQKR